jgi:hypothetical protein
MLRFVLFAIAVVSLSAQTPKRTIEERIEDSDKLRDLTVLRSVSALRIGDFGIVSDTGTVTNISSNDGRKLLFDSLVRYNVPVEWTPTISSGYTTEIPTLFFSNSHNKSGCTNGCVVIHNVFRLEVFETVTLQRVKPVKRSVVVWSVEEEADFEHEPDKDEIITALKRLAEKFSLSYLAANR